MAIISELYFYMVDCNFELQNPYNNELKDQYNLASDKADKLFKAGCNFADFGTRRRRSFMIQDTVMQAFTDCHDDKFTGTSNVYFAMKYGVKPIGTMAHEWIMGTSVLEGLRNANYYALHNWVRVYNADLGIALTDTYGLSSFLRNFNLRLAKLYDGVRHDSGDPLIFADKIIKMYQEKGIDPMSKIIVFSDGLDVDEAIRIGNYCKNKIKNGFGIGTHFTNDFGNSPALNMVIKLWSVSGIPVVKLPDTEGKVMGDAEAVAVARWVHQNKSLRV